MGDTVFFIYPHYKHTKINNFFALKVEFSVDPSGGMSYFWSRWFHVNF